MRRVKPEYDFDLWMPKLSPSTRLLNKYVVLHQISWNEFKPLFLAQLRRQKKLMKFLSQIVEKQNVTLLCWETESNQCHRSIVLEEVQKLYPKLQTNLG